MQQFLLSEGRALDFHRAVMAVVRDRPDLIERAKARVASLRTQNPRLSHVYDRWVTLLEAPVAELARAVLADDPDGGLLRAHSPLESALSAAERNVLWRRIGLGQFVGFFLDAAADLALTTAEQAAVAARPVDEVAGWADSPPVEIDGRTLDRLKQVVGVHRTLHRVLPDREARRAWLREPHPELVVRPLDMMVTGELATLQAYLVRAVGARLTVADVPRH